MNQKGKQLNGQEPCKGLHRKTPILSLFQKKYILLEMELLLELKKSLNFLHFLIMQEPYKMRDHPLSSFELPQTFAYMTSLWVGKTNKEGKEVHKASSHTNSPSNIVPAYHSQLGTLQQKEKSPILF